MDAKIKINMDNEAFNANPHGELARILRRAANRLDAKCEQYFPIMDENGNKVGELEISE